MRHQNASCVLIQIVDAVIFDVPKRGDEVLNCAQGRCRILRPLIDPYPPLTTVPGYDSANGLGPREDRSQGGRA